MLEALGTRTVHETVYRITSLPSEKLLEERGANSESLDEIRNLLNSLGNPLTVDQIIDHTFQPKPKGDESNPFPVSRFSDGTFGVFYSAIEIPTCKREVESHLADEIAENGSETLPYTRYYQLIECNYSGTTVDLRGKEKVHSELVSSDKTGYHFCQQLGAEAKELELAGLLTRSARQAGGTCVPVFERVALSNPNIVREVVLTDSGDGMKFQNS